MAKTVIEVKKNPNENNTSVLRRFSRRIQESGIIRKVKGARYNLRKESKLKVKKSALKRMGRRKEIEKLKKLGKMVTKKTMQEKLSIINKTKARLPRLPFLDIKNDILGKNYSLSLAFVDEKTSQKINKEYRGKDRPTNILSFLLHKNEGEILICPPVVRREAKNFERNFSQFMGFLVIHGMFHLKGHEHSSTMERLEEKYDKKYFGGDRRGVVHDESCGRGISKRRKKS